MAGQGSGSEKVVKCVLEVAGEKIERFACITLQPLFVRCPYRRDVALCPLTSLTAQRLWICSLTPGLQTPCFGRSTWSPAVEHCQRRSVRLGSSCSSVIQWSMFHGLVGSLKPSPPKGTRKLERHDEEPKPYTFPGKLARAFWCGSVSKVGFHV